MKLLILHDSIKDDLILNNSFNNDCIVRYESEFPSLENLLSSINDINSITNLAFIYHYPGYCQLPFYDDLPGTTKTYQYFTNNVVDLINNLKLKGLETIDLLSCDLNYDSFIQEMNQIQTDLNINIRYSLDQTGNNPNGNWILESDNIDVKNLYFNDNINNWNGILNNNIGNAVRSGAYSSIIKYNPVTKVFKVVKDFFWNAATVGLDTNFIQLNIDETFDGNGFKITAPFGCPGMFAINTTGANTSNRPIIKNIGIIGGSTAGNGSFLLRRYSNFFIIDTCYATGPITGGLAGSMAGADAYGSGIIRNCFATGAITDDCGGIAGGYCSCVIQNCYTTGNVGLYAGGMVAPYCGACIIQNCYNSSTNQTTRGIIGNVAGFVGLPIMANSYSNGAGVGNTSGQDYYIKPSQGGTVNGNYQLSTSTFGSIPTFLNSSSTYNTTVNPGNGYVADTTVPTGYPILYTFTQSPWNASSYLHNTSTPNRLMLMSEPVIYYRPLTLSNTVELYWYPPLINNGYNIDSYIMECSNLSYINVFSSDTRKSIIRNLVTGTSYEFSIVASNIFGNSNIASYNLIIPGFKPNIPTNMDFTNSITNYSQMNFNFNTPSFIGNSNITYSTVTMVPVDVTGNILNNSQFIHDHSTDNSTNIIPALFHEEFNTNFNYKSYMRCQNTVNDSDKNFFNFIMNPSLPTSGLKLWLDPYDLTTLTFSNNKIIKWEDKSKNRSNATISESLGPTYDSSNALINFNGSQYLNLPANTLPSSNSSYSIFTYVSTSNIARSGQWYLYSGSPTANLSLGGFINSNLIVHSWWTNQLTGNSNISTNISYLIENTFDSGIRRTYLNGTLIDQDLVSNRNSTTSNNLIGTNSNFTGNLLGSIGDIIVYDRILNNLERNSVKNYLEKKKYNLSLQNIGNVITWLDATDTNNLFDINNEIKVSYNDYVYNWIDRSYSNNNASQSNISNLPIRRPYIQNNLDVLEFNQSFLTIPTAKYPLDAFMVLKLANISDQNGLIGIGPSGNNYSSLSDISGSRWAIDATSNSVVASTTETSSNFLLMEWSIGNNNNYIRRYGSNIANVTTGTWTLPNNSNIYIGNANGFDFSKKFKGYIGEIMMFNKQLDDSDRYPIEGYLAWKWGLQSFLSSSHPFKNSAPYLFYKYLTISSNTTPSVSNLFSPANINGLQLWLDAADPFGNSTILSNGTQILTWFDKSGNQRNTNSITGTPTLNSINNINGIYFDGSSFFKGPFTYTLNILNSFLVGIYDSSSNDFGRLLSFGTTSSNDFDNPERINIFSRESNTNEIVSYRNAYIGRNMNVTYGQPFIVNTLINGTNSLSYLNGTNTSTYSTSGNFNFNTYGIGNSAGINSQPFKGYIFEILTYTNVLSTFERQRIEGYLAWKWALQSNLPSIHPFKNAAPTNDFHPMSINGLSFWLDATKITNYSNGQTLISLNDISSNNYSSSSTAYPTYQTNGLNSNPVIRFNGSTQFLNFGNVLNIGSAAGISIFSVVNYNTSDDGGIIGKSLFGSAVSRWALIRLSLTNPNSVIFMVSNSTDPGIAPETNYTDATTGARIVGAVWDRSTLYNYKNGTQMSSISASDSGTLTNSYNLYVGAYGNESGTSPKTGTFLNGDIGEVLVFLEPLSSFDRQRVEGYLAWKWGLQSNLPSNHPYKNNAP